MYEYVSMIRLEQKKRKTNNVYINCKYWEIQIMPTTTNQTVLHSGYDSKTNADKIYKNLYGDAAEFWRLNLHQSFQ